MFHDSGMPGYTRWPGMIKKAVLAGTFIFLASVAVSNSAAAQRLEEVVSGRFLLKEGGLVSVTSPRGNIRIQSWGKDYVEVAATKVVEGSSESGMNKALERIRVEFVGTQDSLHMKTELGEPRFKTFFLIDRIWNFFSNTRTWVDYQIWVPSEVNVLIKTTSGSSSIQGIEGNVKSEGVSGKVEFFSIRGNIEATTISGEMELVEIEGNVNLRSRSGNMYLDQVKGYIFARSTKGKLQMNSVEGTIRGLTVSGKIVMRKIKGVVELAETTRGDIEIELVGVADDWLGMIFYSVSGDIAVNLPPDLGANLGVKTVSGRITCDFTILTRGQFEPGTLGGPINGGGPLLEIETTDGDIFIRQI